MANISLNSPMILFICSLAGINSHKEYPKGLFPAADPGKLLLKKNGGMIFEYLRPFLPKHPLHRNAFSQQFHFAAALNDSSEGVEVPAWLGIYFDLFFG